MLDLHGKCMYIYLIGLHAKCNKEVRYMRVKLRELRKQKGVSQSFLAKQLGFSHPSGYCNIEQGRNRLSLDQAAMIAEILGVSVDDLTEDSDPFFLNKLHIKCKTTA